MRRKKRSTLTHAPAHRAGVSTKTAVFIGLNRQVRRDNRAELITLPLLHLTPLLVWAWPVSQRLIGLTQSFDPFDRPFGRFRTQRWESLGTVASQWLIHRLDPLAYSLNIGVTRTGIGLRSVLDGLGAPL